MRAELRDLRGQRRGLRSGDQIGGPIRLGLGLAERLPGTRQIFSEKIYLRVPGDWETGSIFLKKISMPSSGSSVSSLPLAEASVSVFAISTFDTDLLLVVDMDSPAALDAPRTYRPRH